MMGGPPPLKGLMPKYAKGRTSFISIRCVGNHHPIITLSLYTNEEALHHLPDCSGLKNSRFMLASSTCCECCYKNIQETHKLFKQVLRQGFAVLPCRSRRGEAYLHFKQLVHLGDVKRVE